MLSNGTAVWIHDTWIGNNSRRSWRGTILFASDRDGHYWVTPDEGQLETIRKDWLQHYTGADNILVYNTYIESLPI